MEIHPIKGREYDVAILVGGEDDGIRLPNENASCHSVVRGGRADGRWDYYTRRDIAGAKVSGVAVYALKALSNEQVMFMLIDGYRLPCE